MVLPRKAGAKGSESGAPPRGSDVKKALPAPRRRSTANKDLEALPDALTVTPAKVPAAPKSKADGKAPMDEAPVVTVSGPLLRPHGLLATALCKMTSFPSYVRILSAAAGSGGGLLSGPVTEGFYLESRPEPSAIVSSRFSSKFRRETKGPTLPKIT